MVVSASARTRVFVQMAVIGTHLQVLSVLLFPIQNSGWQGEHFIFRQLAWLHRQFSLLPTERDGSSLGVFLSGCGTIMVSKQVVEPAIVRAEAISQRSITTIEGIEGQW